MTTSLAAPTVEFAHARRARWLAISIIASLIMAPPSFAQADPQDGPLDCVWRALPGELRANVREDFGPRSPFLPRRIPQGDMDRAVASCEARYRWSDEAVGTAVAFAQVSMIFAAHQKAFSDGGGISGAVEQTWADLAESDRQAAIDQGAISPAVREKIAAAFRPDPGSIVHVVAALTALTKLKQFEAAWSRLQ